MFPGGWKAEPFQGRDCTTEASVIAQEHRVRHTRSGELKKNPPTKQILDRTSSFLLRFFQTEPPKCLHCPHSLWLSSPVTVIPASGCSTTTPLVKFLVKQWYIYLSDDLPGGCSQVLMPWSYMEARSSHTFSQPCYTNTRSQNQQKLLHEKTQTGDVESCAPLSYTIMYKAKVKELSKPSGRVAVCWLGGISTAELQMTVWLVML